MRRAHFRPWLFRREDGQATFEFVLLLPVFLIVVLLAVDGGLLMYNYVSASNAVRDAARYGSVNCAGGCTAAGVEARAADSSGGFMQDGDFEATWTGTDKGDSVVVRVVGGYHYEFLFLPGIEFGVSSCAQMRLESDETGSVPVDSTANCD